MAARVAHAQGLMLLACLIVDLVCAADNTPPAYRRAAESAGVPPRILFAVALQESGMTYYGRHMPWPWTLNVAGTGLRFESRAAACAKLMNALREHARTRVDVGLGQINVGFHGHRVARPCDLLDPFRNLALAAAILREQHTPGEDWMVAVGRYHRPAGGAPPQRYRRKVQEYLAQLTP